MMTFSPDISQVEIINFRPYMIECGFDYYMVAKKSEHKKMEIQCVMSALCIEVLLKSFNSSVVGKHGKLNETYKFERSSLPKKTDPHDLVILSEALSPSIRNYLFDSLELKTLEENRSIFKNSRYIYEETANIEYLDCIIQLAAQTLSKIIYLYQKRGCKDPFISDINVNEFYFGEI